MHVLCVDDEPESLNRLSRMLKEFGIKDIATAEDGLSALAQANERRPDLVLLDISMPEVDGFDVARGLPQPKPLIVFQTAHDEYALKAFDYQAVDYLVKPISKDRLKRALDRAKRRLGEETGSDTDLDELQMAVQVQGSTTRALVRVGRGHKLIPFKDIIGFKTEEREVYAVLEDREFLTDYSLKELETRLADQFCRISRGELVNLKWVSGFESNGDGSMNLILTNDRRVRVARRRAAEIRKIIQT